MLDAESDLKRRLTLDRPPRVDKLAAIRELSAAGQDRGWIRAFIAAITGPGKLTADEFYYYGLDRPGITAEEVRAYVGKSVQHRMHSACNDSRWFAPAHDKALFYTILRGAGLASPETLAFLGVRARGGHRAAELSAEALESLVREADRPVFAKPVAGIFSIGALLIEGAEGDRLRVRGHGSVTTDELIDYMRRVSPEGYLLQTVLSGHPALPEVTGGTVASLRFLVISSEEPEVLSAVLKLAAGANVADNFWRPENLLAAVDRESGTVGRAIVNRGRRLPDEEPSLRGFAVPDWAPARELALEAASLFPAIRTQSWDVALTDRGPVLLEFNFGGDLNLHQMAHGRGILDTEFSEHLRRCGYKGKL